MLNEFYNLLVVRTVLVAYASALRHFEPGERNLDRFQSFAVHRGREDQRIVPAVIFVGKDAMVHGFAFLPELFDANVRYSGSGIGYNLAAIVGAAFVPTIATWLSSHWGVHSVGLYLAVMAVCCLVSVLTCKETKDVDFTK